MDKILGLSSSPQYAAREASVTHRVSSRRNWSYSAQHKDQGAAS